MTRHILRLTGALLLALLLAACWGEPQYPSALVEADSLLMRSEYGRADSVLAAYRRQMPEESHGVMVYRRLLEVGLRYKLDQPMGSLLQVDSLLRYYKHRGTREKYAKSLFYMGYTYYYYDNFSAAMDYYLQAQQAAEEAGDVMLQAWIANQQGAIYFEQMMLSECVEPYRRFDRLTRQTGNAYQMSIAQIDMGRVYTIENNVDSAIYAYNQSIELSSGVQVLSRNTRIAKSQLADLYTQIEEYDSAAMYMCHDSLGNREWADWHAAQNHVDSAIYYYEKNLNDSDELRRSHTEHFVTAWILRRLIKLEESRGNKERVLQHYALLADIEDSIRVQSSEAETRRVKAQYEYDQVKQQRDDMERQMNTTWYVMAIFLLAIGFVAAYAYARWQAQLRRQQEAADKERLLRQQEEERSRKSVEQQKKNEATIAALNQALQRALQAHDEEKASQIQLEAKALETENDAIEASQRRQAHFRKELESSLLFDRIRINAGKEHFRLTDAEWEELRSMIDRAYDDFTRRLLSLAELSELELQTCYLVKLKVKPAAMAVMFSKSKSAISLMRQRMYKKLTGREAPAATFDAFIQNF